MKISIITINWNNNEGLKRTLESVVSQTSREYEYIVVDGASTDGSVETIVRYANHSILRWVSEPDGGIYNAMNKGIRMATGEYVMMLNSGDWFVGEGVLEALLAALERNGYPDILYGTTTKVWPNGRTMKNRSWEPYYSMFSFYRGSLDHVGTLIRRELFDRYGMYDESMKICSDWAWFMRVVVFSNVQPVHVDVDSVFFDMTGISEDGGRNRLLIERERRKAIETLLPRPILADYDRYSDDIVLMRRIRRHPFAYRMVRLTERLLFKMERCRKRGIR